MEILEGNSSEEMRLVVMKTIIIKLHCHLVFKNHKMLYLVKDSTFKTEFKTNENDAYAG